MSLSVLGTAVNSSTSSYGTSSGDTAATASAQASASATPAAQVLGGAAARVSALVASATTQLSSFGQMKSAVSDAQLAARGLTGLTSASSAADALAAAKQFVSRFNAAIAAAKVGGANGGPNGAGASASPGATAGAGRIQRELTHALTNDTSTMAALRKMGLKTAADGSLALDTAKFTAAAQADPAGLRATLAKAGQAVDKTAGSELAADGTLTQSVALLTRRTSDLKTQQSLMAALQQVLAGQDTASTSAAAPSGSVTGYGLKAYQTAAQLSQG